MTEETFDWVQSRRGGDESFDDLFDPETSIDYGCYLLSVLLTEFGSVENALCAYHAGWGSVKQWLDNPEYSDDGATLDHIPFGDTRSYVKKVLDSIEIYQDLYGIA